MNNIIEVRQKLYYIKGNLKLNLRLQKGKFISAYLPPIVLHTTTIDERTSM